MAPHLMALDRELTDIATGKNKRLIVEMPPRHGKSELNSKYFPAWFLGTFPTKNVLLTSATDDLAADFSMAARDLLLEYGPSVFGVEVREDVQARHRWQLKQGGTVRAAGVGTAIFGRGGDLLIVDDYFGKMEDALSEAARRRAHQWFMGTSRNRLSPEGGIVIVATRYHPQDLIGSLLSESGRGGEQYRHLRFPALAEADDPLGRQPGEALWPQRYSQAWLEKERSAVIASGYEWMWEALYQQNPPETLDAEFSPAYFRDIWFDDWPSDIVWRVVALDPSLGKTDKADYSAFVLLAVTMDGMLYVDADLGRRDASRIVADAVGIVRRFQPHAFGCEANQFQAVLAGNMDEAFQRAGVVLPVQMVYNRKNKRERIREALTELLATGRFRFRRNSPGASLLVEQLKGFPTCKYDDGPDALEQAVQLIQHVSYGGLEQPQEQSYSRVYA